MIATVVILLLIVLYSIFVIQKKKKDIKEGKFCSCGCQDCPSGTLCKRKMKK